MSPGKKDIPPEHLDMPRAKVDISPEQKDVSPEHLDMPPGKVDNSLEHLDMLPGRVYKSREYLVRLVLDSDFRVLGDELIAGFAVDLAVQRSSTDIDAEISVVVVEMAILRGVRSLLFASTKRRVL